VLPIATLQDQRDCKRKGGIGTTKHTLYSLAFFITVFSPFPQRMVCAQNAAPRVTSKPVGDNFQPITDEDIQMMRKDIRSQRKQIIAANLKLTDAEAEKFWPVYEQYISDLVNINGTKYALIVGVLPSRARRDPQVELRRSAVLEVCKT